MRASTIYRSALWLMMSHAIIGVVLVDCETDNDLAKLKALCSGSKTSLNTVEDLEKLVNSLDKPGHGCWPRAIEALRQMKQVTDGKIACTIEKAEAISKFVNDFVKDFQPIGERWFPESLVTFAISYGMRLSNICKKEMMFWFMPEADAQLLEKLSNSIVHDVEREFRQFSPLNLIVRSITHEDELVLPSDLFEVVPDLKQSVKKYITSTVNVAEWKALCANSFEPLYKPGLLPLALLIRAGFNYHDREFSTAATSGNFVFERVPKRLRYWSNVLFLCECLKDINTNDQLKLVKNNEPSMDLKMREVPFFRPLSDEEKSAEPSRGYEARMEVDNQVVEQSKSSTLKSRVESFDANKSPSDRLREMILERKSAVFDMLKSVRVDTKQEDVTKALVDLMDAKVIRSLEYISKRGARKVLGSIPAAVYATGATLAIPVVMASKLSTVKGAEFGRKAGLYKR